MKRPLVAVLAIGLLSACAGITAPGAAKSETPAQSLATTGQRMSQLQSAKFDLAGTVTLTLPQQLVDQLKAKGDSTANYLSSTTTVNLKITGGAQRPDQFQATVTAKIGGLTINSEAVGLGGTLYYKDPLTGKWQTLKHHTGAGAENGTSKLSYQAVLDTAKSVTEVGDSTSLNGVSVDHYQVVPDLAKLLALVSADKQSKNAQMAAIIQEVLKNVNLTADVWTGVDDHLIHRLSYDLDVTVDLHQLASAGDDSSANAQGLTLPAGSIAHLTAHVVIDAHDFNTKLSIQAPIIVG
jgi:hypothetical protein